MPERPDLTDDGGCFACGKSNPVGLKLEFVEQNGEYVAFFTPAKEHQGFAGIAHGGIICTLLDEAMARYAWIRGRKAVTAEINVRLKRPARVGSILKVTGRIDSEDRRVIKASAQVTDESGEIVAQASARMVKVD